MWGSEAEMDEGRWVQLDTLEEEQILNVIGGDYVPLDKRNFRFVMGQARPKRGRVVVKNPLRLPFVRHESAYSLPPMYLTARLRTPLL